jgi:hypothetical protein
LQSPCAVSPGFPRSALEGRAAFPFLSVSENSTNNFLDDFNPSGPPAIPIFPVSDSASVYTPVFPLDSGSGNTCPSMYSLPLRD